ncbi:MAG: exo-alpha-sialidase [Candidatus Schekmanbacteria bacterium]|nr:exo-alpha-sialidase [Candidatus Schekmanbacteria bacterium]
MNRITDFAVSALVPLCRRSFRAGAAISALALCLGVGAASAQVFSDDVRVNDLAPGDQSAPAIAVSKEGILHVAWTDTREGDTNVYSAASTDGGRTFGENRRANDNGAGEQSSPTLVVAEDGTVFVAWVDDRAGSLDVYLGSSADGGVSFSESARANFRTQGDQTEPTMAVATDGDLYVSWADRRTDDADIYVTRSTDGGDTFSLATRANQKTSGNQTAPSILAVAGGTTFAAWTDDRLGTKDVYLARSTDGGEIFSSAVSISDDTGDDQSQVRLALPQDGNGTILYATWTDTRSGSEDIYFGKSTDGGATFGDSVRVNDFGNTAAQNHSSLAVDKDGVIHVAWADNKKGTSDIYYALSTDGGQTFSADVRVNVDFGDEQAAPAVALDRGGRVFVVWQDNRAGSSQDIYLSGDHYLGPLVPAGSGIGLAAAALAVGLCARFQGRRRQE